MTAKLIHAHVFDPEAPSLFVKRKASDPAAYYTVTCSASEKCELFAKGQCAARRLFASHCLFGSSSGLRGPTRRAKNYYTWISEHRKMAAEVGALNAAPDRIAKINGYIWLPYSHIDGALENVPGRKYSFIPEAEFTAHLVVRICAHKPLDWFGNVIRSYPNEVVPLFISHLAETFPDLLNEAAEMSITIQQAVAKMTKVGRKAKLVTLAPNVGTFEGWAWDGTYMTSTGAGRFPPFTPFSAKEMRILPGEDAVVVVTDNKQVTADTVFMD